MPIYNNDFIFIKLFVVLDALSRQISKTYDFI